MNAITFDPIPFLEETARYFEKRPTVGEDAAHWANVYNAENCRKTITALKQSAARVEELEGKLRDIAEHTDPDGGENYRWNDREGCLDTVFSIASSTRSAPDGRSK